VSILQRGADPNATARVLLRSLKPSLHANVDCTALFASIVSRQVAVVRHLLQVTHHLNCSCTNYSSVFSRISTAIDA
jgi:hypothetical protein